MQLQCSACKHTFPGDGSDGQRCPRCLRRSDLRPVIVAERSSRVALRALVALLPILALGAGVGLYIHRTLHDEPAPLPEVDPNALKRLKYGDAERNVERLSALLDGEPCDRSRVYELAQALARASDYRSLVERGSAFLTRCGHHRELQMLLHLAYMQLSEPAQAAEQASQILKDAPRDSNAFGLRAQAYERLGDLEHAEQDYTQALMLDPKLSDVPVALANLYERQGRACEAIAPLEQLAFNYPGAQDHEALRARIELLYAQPECAGLAGAGNAVLRRSPGAPGILARVRLHDRESATFLFDTGASFVTISPALAKRLGLKLDGARKIPVETANGNVNAAYVVLDRVAVGGASATRVPALVMDKLGSTDGLLGMSFLSRFDIHQEREKVTLRTRGH